MENAPACGRGCEAKQPAESESKRINPLTDSSSLAQFAQKNTRHPPWHEANAPTLMAEE
jgi:hypothetical protein